MSSLFKDVLSLMVKIHHTHTHTHPVVPGSQQPQAQLQALALQLLQGHFAAQGADRQRTAFIQGSGELFHKPPQEALDLLLVVHAAGEQVVWVLQVKGGDLKDRESTGFKYH